MSPDSNQPCRICGEPVGSPSLGGPDICAWCDCGHSRDGTRWTYADYMLFLGKPGIERSSVKKYRKSDAIILYNKMLGARTAEEKVNVLADELGHFSEEAGGALAVAERKRDELASLLQEARLKLPVYAPKVSLELLAQIDALLARLK